MSRIKNLIALLIVGSLLIGMIVSFHFIDEQAAQMTGKSFLPGDAKAVLQYIGAFGHGTGCLVAVLLIAALDVARRREIKFVVSATILAGLVATVMKVLVHRNRPFCASVETSERTLSDAVFNNSMQSFPSGHTATAFALAVLLAAIYPRGTKLFYAFAILTGLQRIVSQNHYPSDVFAGAIIGLVSAWAVLYFRSRSTKGSAIQVEADSGETNTGLLRKCA